MPFRDETRLVRAAARNNADLCDLVARAHGATGVFAADVWTSTRRTPTYYPDAVTLDPDAEPGAVLERIDASPGASVKDSFGVLDLAPFGFRVPFWAEWIHRPGNRAIGAWGRTGGELPWTDVADASACSPSGSPPGAGTVP